MISVGVAETCPSATDVREPRSRCDEFQRPIIWLGIVALSPTPGIRIYERLPSNGRQQDG